MDCCNDAHRTLLALTGLLNQFGFFGLVMPYMKPLFNFDLPTIGTRISGGCCSHICSNSLFEKLMYSTKRTEGSFCGENTAPGLQFQGRGLSLLSWEVLAIT